MVEKPREQRLMLAQPLQRGVGEYEIEALVGRCRPSGNIARAPFALGTHCACLFDHCGGTVEPRNRRVRPSLSDHLGAIARTAAEIDNAERPPYFDACDKIAAGPGALVSELQVLFGIPGGH